MRCVCFLSLYSCIRNKWFRFFFYDSSSRLLALIGFDISMYAIAWIWNILNGTRFQLKLLPCTHKTEGRKRRSRETTTTISVRFIPFYYHVHFVALFVFIVQIDTDSSYCCNMNDFRAHEKILNRQCNVFISLGNVILFPFGAPFKSTINWICRESTQIAVIRGSANKNCERELVIIGCLI